MLNVAADAAAAALTSSVVSEEGIVGVFAADESVVGVPAAEEVGDAVDGDVAAAAFSLRFASLSNSCCLSFSYVVNGNRRSYDCQFTQKGLFRVAAL
jgi:hypothetical protein